MGAQREEGCEATDVMSAGSEMPPGVASEPLMASTVLWLPGMSLI